MSDEVRICGDGGLAVAIAATNPLHGGEDGLLHTFDAPPGTADVLLGRLENRARARRWRFLRSELPPVQAEPLRRRGWELSALRVDKALDDSAHGALEQSPALIRCAVPGDGPFMTALAATALRRGLRTCEAAVVKEGLLQAHAAALVTSPSVMGLIAVRNGERAGHSLCEVVSDPRTVKARAILLDTFVVDRFRGRGIAEALVAAVEIAAALNGFDRLSATVCAPDRAAMESILRRIKPQGWATAAESLVLPLNPAL